MSSAGNICPFASPSGKMDPEFQLRSQTNTAHIFLNIRYNRKNPKRIKTGLKNVRHSICLCGKASPPRRIKPAVAASVSLHLCFIGSDFHGFCSPPVLWGKHFPHFRIKVDHLWDLQRKQLFKFRKLQPHRMNPDKPSEMTIQRQKQSKCDTGA